MATQAADVIEEGHLVANDDTGEPQSPAPRDFEAEAAKHGWTPKDEFKGDPSRWIDAEPFMKRADEVMPLLKKKTEAQDREIADLKKQFKRATEFFSKAEERAYDRAFNDLKEKQRQAVASGDTEAFDALDKEIGDLKKDLPKSETPKVTKEEAMEALEDWRDQNPWYDRANLASASEDMIEARIYADRMMDKHVAKTADMAPADYFKFIEGLVVEKYPSVKAKPARIKPASDVAAPTNGRARNGGKSFNDLPPEAQRACDKWVKQGIIKSREDYVKSYDWN